MLFVVNLRIRDVNGEEFNVSRKFDHLWQAHNCLMVEGRGNCKQASVYALDGKSMRKIDIESAPRIWM